MLPPTPGWKDPVQAWNPGLSGFSFVQMLVLANCSQQVLHWPSSEMSHILFAVADCGLQKDTCPAVILVQVPVASVHSALPSFNEVGPI